MWPGKECGIVTRDGLEVEEAAARGFLGESGHTYRVQRDRVTKWQSVCVGGGGTGEWGLGGTQISQWSQQVLENTLEGSFQCGLTSPPPASVS